MTPDDVPQSITMRAYGLKGVSQNVYAAVYADAYDVIRHEAAEEIRVKLAERVKPRGGGVWEIRTISTAQHAADLIDPGVQES